MMIDEISLLLKQRIITKVSTLKQIADILKKTEQSQRVLEEASEGFQIIREDENTGAEETLTIDKLTAAQLTPARSSGWSIPRFSPRCSGALPTFTSRPATIPSSSSSASTAC